MGWAGGHSRFGGPDLVLEGLPCGERHMVCGSLQCSHSGCLFDRNLYSTWLVYEESCVAALGWAGLDLCDLGRPVNACPSQADGRTVSIRARICGNSIASTATPSGGIAG